MSTKVLPGIFLFCIGVLSYASSIPRFIVSPYAFFDRCDVDDPYNSSAMSGIEFNAVRDAFKIAGYIEGQDFIFECLPWPESTDAVYQEQPGDNVLGVIIGLPIIAEDMRNGFKYSQGTFQIGFGIGYFQNITSTYGVGSWFFVKPFTISLYLVMMAMPVVFALILWFYEGRNMSFLNYLFHLTIYYFKLDFLKKLNAESRIVEFIFQVYCMVVILTYTSQMVDIISNLKSNGGVRTFSDLRGMRITTDPTYLDYVTAVYGRPVELYEPIQLSTIDDFIFCLENQDVPYFLFENAIVEALTESDCRFSTVLTNALEINYAILWSKLTATQEMIERMDIAIIEALDQKNQSVRFEEGKEAASTKTCSNPSSGSMQININDMYGLWVIWGLCLGVAIIFKLLSMVSFGRKWSFLNFYDLEIRGPREKKLMGAVNSRTTFVAMVSKDMIRKTREQAVATYSDCFNTMQFPLRTRLALLFLMKRDPEFRKLLKPMFIARKARKSIFDAFKESLFKKAPKKSLNMIKIPNPQILNDYQKRLPSAPDITPKHHSIDLSVQPTDRVHSCQDIEEIVEARIRRRLKTRALVSGLNDKVLKFNANLRHALHHKLDKHEAKEMVAYYEKRYLDIEVDLSRMKEEGDQFAKDATKKHSEKSSSPTTIVGFSEAVAGRNQIKNDNNDSMNQGAIIRSTVPRALNSSYRIDGDDSTIVFLREEDSGSISDIRSMELAKKSRFGVPPIYSSKIIKPRKNISPFVYKKTDLKQFSKAQK